MEPCFGTEMWNIVGGGSVPGRGLSFISSILFSGRSLILRAPLNINGWARVTVAAHFAEVPLKRPLA